MEELKKVSKRVFITFRPDELSALEAEVKEDPSRTKSDIVNDLIRDRVKFGKDGRGRFQEDMEQLIQKNLSEVIHLAPEPVIPEAVNHSQEFDSFYRVLSSESGKHIADLFLSHVRQQDSDKLKSFLVDAMCAKRYYRDDTDTPFVILVPYLIDPDNVVIDLFKDSDIFLTTPEKLLPVIKEGMLKSDILHAEAAGMEIGTPKIVNLQGSGTISLGGSGKLTASEESEDETEDIFGKSTSTNSRNEIMHPPPFTTYEEQLAKRKILKKVRLNHSQISILHYLDRWKAVLFFVEHASQEDMLSFDDLEVKIQRLLMNKNKDLSDEAFTAVKEVAWETFRGDRKEQLDGLAESETVALVLHRLHAAIDEVANKNNVSYRGRPPSRINLFKRSHKFYQRLASLGRKDPAYKSPFKTVQYLFSPDERAKLIQSYQVDDSPECLSLMNCDDWLAKRMAFLLSHEGLMQQFLVELKLASEEVKIGVPVGKVMAKLVEESKELIRLHKLDPYDHDVRWGQSRHSLPLERYFDSIAIGDAFKRIASSPEVLVEEVDKMLKSVQNVQEEQIAKKFKISTEEARFMLKGLDEFEINKIWDTSVKEDAGGMDLVVLVNDIKSNRTVESN